MPLPTGSLKSRWDALSEADQARFSPLCPDFVIELRSPSDNLKELEKKMELWIANDAQLAWLIDPIEQEVTTYRPVESPEVHHYPASILSELKDKMEMWIANGAQLAWLIDPIEQEGSIYRPGESPEVHHNPTSVQGEGVMAGFELVMARICE